MHGPRILVLRGGAIGDFILTLPAVNALRRRWPEAYIEIIGYPHIVCLAQATGLVNRVRSLDAAGMARFFSLRPRIPEEQASYMRSFDLVISYLYDPDEVARRNIRAAGARQLICASPIVKGSHAIDHLIKPLEDLAIYPEKQERAQLVLRARDLERGRERIRRFGPRVLAIHPGSGSPTKNWGIGNFVALADKLVRETMITPVFIIGEADSEIARCLAQQKSDVPVLSECSLIELAEALSGCEGYTGNDSGITHLAAAVGIPVVALFGPTDPRIWGPRGGRVRIIHAGDAGNGGLETITVQNVFGALKDLDVGGRSVATDE